MRKRKPFEGDIREIETAIKKCDDAVECRRILCVYLAMTYPDMTNAQIAKSTVFSKSQVKVIHSKYRKGGLDALADGRGGRYRQNMTLSEEVELLAPFEEMSKSGRLVVAGKVKKAYEEKIGKEVAESTIYRLLDRHDFRKITPCRRHKKADKAVQEAFKKTSRT